jgi:hypothetical protein
VLDGGIEKVQKTWAEHKKPMETVENENKTQAILPSRQPYKKRSIDRKMDE